VAKDEETKEVLKRLKEFDEKYENDPNVPERLRKAYRNNRLTPEELNREFTI